MPVSIPKCTVGIKESSSALEKDEFLTKELLTTMVVDHYFAKGGVFYQELYQAELIDGSFSFETNIDFNFGYTLIGGNTTKRYRICFKSKRVALIDPKSGNYRKRVFANEEKENWTYAPSNEFPRVYC